MERDSKRVSADLGEAILASSADAILATNRQGGDPLLESWRRPHLRLFGAGSSRRIAGYRHSRTPQATNWGGWNRVMATGATRYGAGDLLAVPAVTRDGRQISVEFTIILLHGADGIGGMAAIMRDVTTRFDEIRRLRRQLAGSPA